MDEYKYITYSSLVPEGTKCIRVGASKTPEHVLIKVNTYLWNYPTFEFDIRPEPSFLSPYGNLFWLFDCVWVAQEIYTEVWEYLRDENNKPFRRPKIVLASVEVQDDSNILDICRQIKKSWA